MKHGFLFKGMIEPGELSVDRFVDMLERLAEEFGLSIGGGCRATGYFQYFIVRPDTGVTLADRVPFLRLHKHPLVREFVIEHLPEG